MKRLSARLGLAGYLFAGPWLLGLLVFNVGPLLLSLWYSLCDYSVLSPPVFLGLANYIDLFHDRVFGHCLWVTLRFVLLMLPVSVMLSLVAALALQHAGRARGLLRSIFFLPSLVPLVAVAVLWNWILNGKYGALNHLLECCGLGRPNWLDNPRLVPFALLFASAWGVGQAIVIYIAALGEVPTTLYEASKIDGASRLQQTLHVTLPSISPAIYFNVLLTIIGLLQVFALPFVMTGTGPARSSYFFSMYIFDSAFQYLRMGYACAMAWIMFLMILGITFFMNRILRSHVTYAQ